MTKVMVNVDQFMEGKKTYLGLALYLVYSVLVQTGVVEKSDMIENGIQALIGFGLYQKLAKSTK